MNELAQQLEMPLPSPSEEAPIDGIRGSHKHFLLDIVHADHVRHSGRSLYQHLCGTHALLKAWNNPDDVCVAGLFHSIYGTRQFKHKTWPIADRQPIRRLIGNEAERLAYWFCTLDRPAALFFVLEHLDKDTKRKLREIEAANLLEQQSASRWLKRLLDTDISDNAKATIREYLEE